MELTNLIISWLNRIATVALPDEDIVALNFGIFESSHGYSLYLTGANVYDSDDDDWATKIDFEIDGSDKYLSLSSPAIAGKQWNEVVNTVSVALADLIKLHPYHPILKDKIVTTGFDDGDLVRIV